MLDVLVEDSASEDDVEAIVSAGATPRLGASRRMGSLLHSLGTQTRLFPDEIDRLGGNS